MATVSMSVMLVLVSCRLRLSSWQPARRTCSLFHVTATKAIGGVVVPVLKSTGASGQCRKKRLSRRLHGRLRILLWDGVDHQIRCAAYTSGSGQLCSL